jgi:hypothetical protein
MVVLLVGKHGGWRIVPYAAGTSGLLLVVLLHGEFCYLFHAGFLMISTGKSCLIVFTEKTYKFLREAFLNRGQQLVSKETCLNRGKQLIKVFTGKTNSACTKQIISTGKQCWTEEDK